MKRQIQSAIAAASAIWVMALCGTCGATALNPPPDEAITLHVNTGTGAMYFTGVAGSNMSFYQVSSASDSLVDSQWLSFQDQSILNPSDTITSAPAGEIVDWMEMENNNGILQDMACANMMPNMNGLPVAFDTATRTYGIGDPFLVGGQEDLQFIYNTDLNYTPDYTGTIIYESSTPEPASAGLLGIGCTTLLLKRRRRHTTCLA